MEWERKPHWTHGYIACQLFNTHSTLTLGLDELQRQTIQYQNLDYVHHQNKPLSDVEMELEFVHFRLIINFNYGQVIFNVIITLQFWTYPIHHGLSMR